MKCSRALFVPICWSLVLALPNAWFISQRSPSQLSDRLLHHVFDAGQLIALGLAIGLAWYCWSRWLGSFRRFGLLAIFAVSLTIGWLSLPSSFEGFARRTSESLPYWLVLGGSVVLVSGSLPFSVWLGRVAARHSWRYLMLVAAAAGATVNHLVLDRDYYGLHLFLTLNAMLLGVAALSGSRRRTALRESPSPTSEGANGLVRRVRHWFGGPRTRWVPHALYGTAVVVGVSALLFPTPRVLLRLNLLEGAPLVGISTALTSAFSTDDSAELSIVKMDPESQQWFTDRAGLPPIAPSGPSLLPTEPIVVLLTIDSFRADLLRKKKSRTQLSYFREFAKTAVDFRLARSPGSATVPALATLFSGKYYSQLLWKRLSRKSDWWPATDNSVRFPELLRDSGVGTFSVASWTWLRNKQGVVRGFDEVINLDTNRKIRAGVDIGSHEILDNLKRQIEKNRTKPLFLYAHIMDPHWPHDYGGVKGSKFQRYLGEFARLGKNLRRFDAWLKEQGLIERTSVILTADHGEAFGEHNTSGHSKTVYEELLRVPLLVRIPGVAPKKVEAPVSLADLGPTLLDLYGLPTPGHYMGQSLVPFLRGQTPSLTRPIVAETRLLQTIIFPNSKKVIYDARSGGVELYDLAADRRERNNLADSAESSEVSIVKHFFAKKKHPSYSKHAPYRR